MNVVKCCITVKGRKKIDPQKIMFPCTKLSILYFAKKISTEINLTELYKFLALFLIRNSPDLL